MTVSKATERADNLRPNPFTQEEKVKWLSEIEGKIFKEFLSDDFSPIDYSKDEERELILEEEYQDVYLFYLVAMIDFFSRDYADYNNSMEMFNTAYDKMVKEKRSGKKGGYYKNIF